MDAMKAALMNKMNEARSGKKPDLSIKIGLGKASEVDPMASGHDHKKMLEENDLAPEVDEMKDNQMDMDQSSKLDELMMKEKGEEGMMREILSALSDRSMPGRGSNGLAERAAMGAKEKLKGMGPSAMPMKSKY